MLLWSLRNSSKLFCSFTLPMCVLPVSWKPKELRAKGQWFLRCGSCNTASVSRGQNLTRNHRAWQGFQWSTGTSCTPLNEVCCRGFGFGKQEVPRYLSRHKEEELRNTVTRGHGDWGERCLPHGDLAVCFEGTGEFSLTPHGNKSHWMQRLSLGPNPAFQV